MINKINMKQKSEFLISCKKPELMLNNLTFFDYYDRLKNYAINMFEWINLPDTIDARYLELTLFEQGKVVFFKDETLESYLCIQGATSGPFDVYNNPTKRKIFASNGYNKNRTSKNSVIIWNNFLRKPTSPTINLYAWRLTNIERAIDININAQKTPILILANENEKFSLKNMYAEYEGNAPVIYASKNLDLNSISSINTTAPFVADKLQLIKNSYWNEVMTFLGLQNTNQDKKERLITDEANAREEQIKQARLNMLDARKEACKLINKMFGLDIDVRFRIDNEEFIEKVEDKVIENFGGIENE